MMYKVFFDNRTFIISDNFDECFSQSNGIATKVTCAEQMSELIAYFETAHQSHSLWVYASAIDEAYKWLMTNFTTIEAAGGLVKNKLNEYLLIYRFAHWDLPKGKREKNESPEETALREVEEECNISNLQLYNHITNTHHVYRLNDKLCMKKTYWYAMTYNGNAQPSPQTEEAIEKAIWVSPNTLHQYSPLMFKSIIEVFQNLDINLIQK